MKDSPQQIQTWTDSHVKNTLPGRAEDAHKGTYGTALLVAGSASMPGAALLAGNGAMRGGLGKLEIATDETVIPVIVPALPEATYIPNGLDKISCNEFDISHYKAAAVGPGIMPGDQTEQAISRLLNSSLPLLLDAGALTDRSYPNRQAPIILTPHPGEFSRITGCSTEELAKDRAGHAGKWSRKLGVTVVLKGKRTVTAFPDGTVWENPTGNSALAKGGTGDTLSGLILGMLCCHADWKHAVLNAIFLHGACSDRWIGTRSPHSMLAHDITDLLPEVWKSYE